VPRELDTVAADAAERIDDDGASTPAAEARGAARCRVRDTHWRRGSDGSTTTPVLTV
jgi:hypothetical protein